MFFVLRSNDSFKFPLGLIKYIVIVKTETVRPRMTTKRAKQCVYQLSTLGLAL